MRKLFLVLVSIFLLASSAYAIEFTTAQANELGANPKGSVAMSGDSVVLNIWNTQANGGVGISAGSVIVFYENATAITGTRIAAGTAIHCADASLDTAYDTIGEVVDAINADTSGYFKASVGKDAYRGLSSKFIRPVNYAAVGTNEDNAGAYKLDSSNALFISCGVKGKAGYVNRLKSFRSYAPASGFGVFCSVMDGDISADTVIIDTGAYNSTTGPMVSSDSVKYCDGTSKGLSATKGNSLCVVVRTQGTVWDKDTLAQAGSNVSILYDQLAQ